MKKPIIFICHSSKDKSFVRDLTKRLNGYGVETWIDELEIKIGQSIHEKINEGLGKSDFLVVVLSKASVASRWVREELNSAASLEKLKNIGTFILPALLEKCDVPPLLLDRRYANFLDDPEAAFKELLDSIFHHFKDRHPEVQLPDLKPPTIDQAFLKGLRKDPSELLDLPPRAFEQLVSLLFYDLGFEVQITPVTRDGGADVVAMKNLAPGLSPIKTIVECKRYSPGHKVGVEIVRQLYGALQAFKAERGVIVTTSDFTAGARKLARDLSIDLIHGKNLMELIYRT
jgi:hypothetical protein